MGDHDRIMLLQKAFKFRVVFNCWSKCKTILRKTKARTRAALDHALNVAIDRITGSDAKGWFRHCGYAVHRFANRSKLFAVRLRSPCETCSRIRLSPNLAAALQLFQVRALLQA